MTSEICSRSREMSKEAEADKSTAVAHVRISRARAFSEALCNLRNRLYSPRKTKIVRCRKGVNMMEWAITLVWVVLVH
jgi:hypothetical protein